MTTVEMTMRSKGERNDGDRSWCEQTKEEKRKVLISECSQNEEMARTGVESLGVTSDWCSEGWQSCLGGVFQSTGA